MLKKILPVTMVVILSASRALATMPMVTDDTFIQGAGHLQLELGMERSVQTTVNGGTSFRQTILKPSATLSVGLTNSVDLVAGAPWLSQKSEQNGTLLTDEQGMGDLALQLKWHCVEMEEGRFSLALKPGITLPTGDENHSRGNGRVSGGMLLIASHRGALGAVHLNLGYTRNEYRLEADRAASRSDLWNASVAGELNVADHLRAVADTGIQTNQEKGNGTHPAYLLGGLIYSPSGRLDVDLGFKGGLNHAAPDSTLLAGVTLHF